MNVRDRDGLILAILLSLLLPALAGLIGYGIGRNSNVKYGPCINQVMEVRYICTAQSSHGACIDWGLREVPLCVQWQR